MPNTPDDQQNDDQPTIDQVPIAANPQGLEIEVIDSLGPVNDDLPIGEHYKLLIEDARALGDRRETINNLFVSLVSLVAGGQGYILIAFPGQGVGLVVIAIATLFGIRLCSIWRNALKRYDVLLALRYDVLRIWEQEPAFPPMQKFYTLEDALYSATPHASVLLHAVFQGKPFPKMSSFVSLYVELPRVARLIFFALLFVQSMVVLWPVCVAVIARVLPEIIRIVGHG